MNKNIGAQFYTIRNTCQTIEEFDESCKKVKDIGYKVVQLSGIGPFKAEDVKKIVDKYDLEVVCTHRAAANYLENLDEEIHFHKTLGCKICGLGGMPGYTGEETVMNFIENFTPVCKKLEENGLVFGYHNHQFEFQKIKGKYVFDIITEAMNFDNFKYILDVYWLAFAGLNPAEFIRTHSDKIGCIHFKDLKIVRGETMYVPAYAEIGNGNLNWDEIIKASFESKAEYALVEQDACDIDPFESLKISYDYLTKKGFC